MMEKLDIYVLVVKKPKKVKRVLSVLDGLARYVRINRDENKKEKQL